MSTILNYIDLQTDSYINLHRTVQALPRRRGDFWHSHMGGSSLRSDGHSRRPRCGYMRSSLQRVAEIRWALAAGRAAHVTPSVLFVSLTDLVDRGEVEIYWKVFIGLCNSSIVPISRMYPYIFTCTLL